MIENILDSSPIGCSNETLFYLSSLALVKRSAPEVASAIIRELMDQKTALKLIASENFSSIEVQAAMGNLLTDKYAEGYPYHRFYAGCENVDAIEDDARRAACELFGCEHAYVQPHSGADANLIAFWAILRNKIQEPWIAALGRKTALELTSDEWRELRVALGSQRLLAMDLFAGGHLTHGYRYNMSAQLFDVSYYGVDVATGLLDYDELEQQALECRPLILLVGYSAYPRHIDFRRMRAIADRAGSVLMVDMAHFAGLVAGKVFTGEHNPVPYAQVLTSTTHKTLRGPRGGLILSTRDFADSVDKGCPMVMGGPLPHVIAAKAVSFRQAASPDFEAYSLDVVNNAKALAAALRDAGLTLVAGGTDNHLVLADVRRFGLSGRQAESALRECSITLNRNTIPGDPNGPWYTSGLRFGTPAVTTQGMRVPEMAEIGQQVGEVLRATTSKPGSLAKYELSSSARERVRSRISALLESYPLYPEIDIDLLKRLEN